MCLQIVNRKSKIKIRQSKITKVSFKLIFLSIQISNYMFLDQVHKGLNDWWRYILGIAIVISGYTLGQIPLTLLMYYKLASNPELGTEDLEGFTKTMDFATMGISKNVGFFVLILIFLFALVALWLVVKHLHLKNIKDLITPNSQINYQKIFFGFGLWMMMGILTELINYWMNPGDYTFRWSGSSFFILILIALIFLPIQTSFEELFFRGYIMQGIAFFTKHKWIPILISSVLFGLIHGMNPEIERYGFIPMQTYYIVAGLFLAVITVLDDGLELALGVHAATNFFGATFLTYQGSVLQTDTLFITNEMNPWITLLGFVVGASIFIYICMKKYNWPSLNSLFIEDDATNYVRY